MSVEQRLRARRIALASWESQLRQMLSQMEQINGDTGDDIESLIRVAWKLVAAEAARAQQQIIPSSPPVVPPANTQEDT
jgi:hypothetical protein